MSWDQYLSSCLKFSFHPQISVAACKLVDMQLELVFLNHERAAPAPTSFNSLLEAPLALLVCQPERQWSESATSSSWVCATSGHLDPNLMKQSTSLTQRNVFVLDISTVSLCIAVTPGGHPLAPFKFIHLWDVYGPFLKQLLGLLLTDLHFRLCLSCWTVSRVTQAWKTAIVIQLSQGVIVGIRWLPYQHHMKHLWLAGSDGLASILISRASLVRPYCFKVWWHEENFWSACTITHGKNINIIKCVSLSHRTECTMY